MQHRPLRVLLLGGGGWLGAAAAQAFRAAHRLVAPPRTELDLTDDHAVVRAVSAARPDVVVNLAAAMPPRADAAGMEAVNVAGAAAVAAASRAVGARLVHMSSDLVHDGLAAPYADDAPARPVNTYGRSKAAGERAVLAADPAALVVRTSLVVDPGCPDRLTREFLARIGRGERCTLFEDEVRCPIPRATLAAALVELAERGGSGFLNVAGAEAISRFDLGMLLLQRFGARDLAFVHRGRARDHAEPRPIDVRLDVRRASALLRTPLRGIREELALAGPPRV